MTARLRASAALLSALVVLGCGSDGPKTGQVTGEVTLDGAPVDGGIVTFHAPDNNEAVGVGSVSEGKYSATVRVGDAVVRLTGTRPVTLDKKQLRLKKYTDEDIERLRQIFPEKYNAHSDLRVTVKEGANTHDFRLTTK